MTTFNKAPEEKENGMACFTIGGEPEDLQVAVDSFYSLCEGFLKVIKSSKNIWIVCYKTEAQAKAAQTHLDMMRKAGLKP